MEKKSWARPKVPAFSTAIHPGSIVLNAVPAPTSGMPPERILESRSSAAKEHFDKDMQRLRQTLAPGRIEPKVSLHSPATAADLHLQMRQNIDPRSGHVITAKVMPKGAPAPMMLDASHPMNPENQLAIAMRKLNHRL